MPEFGSFSLLLALVLSGYTLLAGGVALRQLATGSRSRISPDRLAETARRAGIGSFFAVTCAAVRPGLHRLCQRLFRLLHPPSFQPRLPGPYKFAALWSGQEGSLLLWAWLLTAYGFVLRLRHKVDVTPHRLRLHHPGRHPDLLSAAAQLRRASVCPGAGPDARPMASD